MGCLYCPPTVGEPFFYRIFHKIFFLLWFKTAKYDDLQNRYLRITKKALILLLWLIPVVTIIVFFELYFLGVKKMKTNYSALISAILLGANILISFYIINEKPNYYNPLVDMLFKVFIAAFSISTGLAINEKRIRRNETNRWMPAAESACKELITISKTANRLKNYQGTLCNQMEMLLGSNISFEATNALKALLRNRCDSCSNGLANIKNHLDKAAEDWRLFLTANCDKGECEKIEERLNLLENKN